MDKGDPVENLWTIRQAATWLSMTERAVRCMLHRREFPAGTLIRLRRRIRFQPEALRRWVLGKTST